LARSRCYTSRYRHVIRAKIVLLASEGMANDAIAARLDTPAPNRQQVASAFSHSTLGWARGEVLGSGLVRCGAYVAFWPNSAVAAIRAQRQLSGDKLPSLGTARDG